MSFRRNFPWRDMKKRHEGLGENSPVDRSESLPVRWILDTRSCRWGRHGTRADSDILGFYRLHLSPPIALMLAYSSSPAVQRPASSSGAYRFGGSLKPVLLLRALDTSKGLSRLAVEVCSTRSLLLSWLY